MSVRRKLTGKNVSASDDYKTTSYLSETCELKGNLLVKGGIRIDGRVTGHLTCQATVFIGETAEIEAEIVTRSLVSGGSVTGSITAEDTVQINRPGSMRGEIRTCRLGIERDVYFSGRCQLLSSRNNKRPKRSLPRLPRKAIPHRD
jgi:cytoskeletal protein CcmA (bactofilin family)